MLAKVKKISQKYNHHHKKYIYLFDYLKYKILFAKYQNGFIFIILPHLSQTLSIKTPLKTIITIRLQSIN